ncbi:MAG: sensor histidine kinase [Rickettsiaceae bacterium]
MSYELNKEKVNLSKLIKERTFLYKKVFSDDAQKQEFKFKIEKDIITECDEYYITQAIDNLISNAVKYGKGNPVTIKLITTKDNEVQFKIIDSGIGIPENELISIFDKFTVSSKTKTPAEGRGIGLTLCEKIIKVHNGRIWAEQNSDKGTTFTFTLPSTKSLIKMHN